jgi:damage-control phosphatase, subfamily III
MNPIRTDASNAFANDTFARRLPLIIRDIQARNEYSVKINSALDDLHKQLTTNAPLPPPPLTAPDAQTWLEACEQHKGETWQNAEWFFAETYFFHLINEIVGYWQTGLDPYKLAKDTEVNNTGFFNRLTQIQSQNTFPRNYLSEMLAMSLWGNRVDLSLPEVMANQSQDVSSEDLLLDDRTKAIERIENLGGVVHLITDNFGTELAMDMFLVEALLALSIPVIVHVKMNPTYVSDATAQDIQWILEIFKKNAAPAFRRLEAALSDGRLRIAPNFFWNSPYFLNKLPSHLMQLFSDASLIILKGDANYRRAFFDTLWPVDKPASEIVNYLHAPLLCLRTVKSECLAGVPLELAMKAEAANPNWRLLGKYGLIQYIEANP